MIDIQRKAEYIIGTYADGYVAPMASFLIEDEFRKTIIKFMVWFNDNGIICSSDDTFVYDGEIYSPDELLCLFYSKNE